MKFLSLLAILILYPISAFAEVPGGKKGGLSQVQGKKPAHQTTAFPAAPPTQPTGEPEPENLRTIFIQNRPVSTKSKTSKKKHKKGQLPQSVPVGLGVTLFQVEPRKAPIRVDTTQIFHTGDHLRFQLEPGMDGYLYIFHTVNNQAPKMLFPDFRLNAGKNEVSAHVPIEIPSRNERSHPWFDFIGDPALEGFYFVVTREPLPGIPTGTGLQKYCEAYGKGEICTWNPDQNIWETITTQAKQLERQEVVQDFGQKETKQEILAKTRDIALGQNAPLPSNLKIAASEQTNIVVMQIELKHQ